MTVGPLVIGPWRAAAPADRGPGRESGRGRAYLSACLTAATRSA